MSTRLSAPLINMGKFQVKKSVDTVMRSYDLLNKGSTKLAFMESKKALQYAGKVFETLPGHCLLWLHVVETLQLPWLDIGNSSLMTLLIQPRYSIMFTLTLSLLPSLPLPTSLWQ